MGQSHTFFAVRERVFGPDGASAAACSPFEPAPGALRALGLGFFFGGDSIVSCSAVSASEAGGESGCSVLARSSRSGNIGP
jgi:hypothetical protein